MQDKPSGAGHERAATTADLDDRDQAAVLREILFIYPEPITLEELIREKTVASTEFAERDRIKLHRRDDDLVIPTRAAVRFYVLFEL